MTSKDVSNWQATQNQLFKPLFSEWQPKMKHRLQGDKKTLRLRQGFAETGCKRWMEVEAYSGQLQKV